MFFWEGNNGREIRINIYETHALNNSHDAQHISTVETEEIRKLVNEQTSKQTNIQTESKRSY